MQARVRPHGWKAAAKRGTTHPSIPTREKSIDLEVSCSDQFVVVVIIKTKGGRLFFLRRQHQQLDPPTYGGGCSDSLIYISLVPHSIETSPHTQHAIDPSFMLSTPSTASSSSSSFATTITTKIISRVHHHHVPAIVVWTVLATQTLLLASLKKTQAFSLSTAVSAPPSKTIRPRVSSPLQQSSTLSAWPFLLDPVLRTDKQDQLQQLLVEESPFLTWKRYKLQQAALENSNPWLMEKTTRTSAAFAATPSPPFWKWWKHPHPAQATSSMNPGALSFTVSGDDDMMHDVSSSSSSLSLVQERNDKNKPDDIRRLHSLVRETTSIATACLVAGVLVYCSANDQMLLVDALRFVCSCFTSLCNKGLLAVARTTTSAAAAASSSNVATTCVHALREVAMVCSAMSVTHKFNHRKLADTTSTTSASSNNNSNTKPESDNDDNDASLSWLARVKMATLHLLPAMNIVLSSASTLGQLQSWNELLYQALVTASSVDN